MTIKVALSLHNLSSSHDEVRRAGIQRVVFEALRYVLTTTTPGVDLIPVLRMPDADPAKTPFFEARLFNASRLVLERTLAELGSSPADVTKRWPFLAPLFGGAGDYDAGLMRVLADVDVLFEVALADMRNVANVARARNPQLKVGMLVHDMAPMIMPEVVNEHVELWFARQYMHGLRDADFTISVSRHTSIELQRYVSPRAAAAKRHFYAPLPSPAGKRLRDPDALAKAVPALAGQRYVASVATLEPRKNLRLLIEAFQRFKQLFPEEKDALKLVLIGAAGWKSDELDDLLATAGSGVMTMGFLPDETLRVVLAQAAFLVLPSRYEGFGLPVAEARAAGVRVITCGNSSLPEAAVLDARFVRPFAVDELALAMKAELNGAAAATAEAWTPAADWTATMSRWVEVFRKVARDRDARVSPSVVGRPVQTWLARDAKQSKADLRSWGLGMADAHFEVVIDKKGQWQPIDVPVDRSPRAGDVIVMTSASAVDACPELWQACLNGVRLVVKVPSAELGGAMSYELASRIKWADQAVVDDELAAKRLKEASPGLNVVLSNAKDPSP